MVFYMDCVQQCSRPLYMVRACSCVPWPAPKAEGQGEGQAWGSDSDLQKAKEPDGLRWLWSSQWGKNHVAILLKRQATMVLL